MTKRRLTVVALAAIVVCLATVHGIAQSRPQAATGLKLYVFDMGHLNSSNPQPLLDRGITVTDMCVTAYLIVHPRGTLIWDTGVIPDELVKPEGTTEARATVHTTLRGQLAGIGYQPSDITYLALSHSHYDHIANANEFAGSTWLARKAEWDFMFPAKPPEKQNTSAPRFAALKNAKTKFIDGDYDVFGDGTVILVSTPGHTPGHQSLFVKLAKTGPVVLSGDLYHYPAELTLKDFNPYGGKTSDAELASRAKLAAFMKERGATLWIGHDIVHFPEMKKSPAFYD